MDEIRSPYRLRAPAAGGATELDRRRFLASAASAFFAAHGCGVAAAAAGSRSGEARQAGEPRIRGLELETSAPLPEMKDFYHRLLGLPVAADEAGRLAIDAGETRVTFRQAPPADEGPFYHFAFNIPENKVRAAYHWQKQRTPLLPIPERLRDPEYPDGVVDYRNWNAHSVFFFDPAGNVVEYIGRHDLDNAAGGDFSSADILYASEIAFVVDDVAAAAAKLQEIAGIGQYRSASDKFAAVGDERGLLLVMKRGRVISFDAPRRKAVTVYPTAAAVRGARPARYAFPDYPYRLSVDA